MTKVVEERVELSCLRRRVLRALCLPISPFRGKDGGQRGTQSLFCGLRNRCITINACRPKWMQVRIGSPRPSPYECAARNPCELTCSKVGGPRGLGALSLTFKRRLLVTRLSLRTKLVGNAGMVASRRPPLLFCNDTAFTERRADHLPWWTEPGSNRRPLRCHHSALPTELSAQKFFSLAAPPRFELRLGGSKPPVLFQLHHGAIKWSGRCGSNARRPGPKPGA